MKRTSVCLAVAVTLALHGAAGAQTFGQFTGAQPLPVNGHLFGAYLQTSQNVLGLLGQLRLSFYPGVDFGFNGGFARQDYNRSSRTTLRLGTDLKYQVLEPATDYPYAVSIGGAIGVETGDDFSLLSLGPSVVSSRTFPGNGNLSFTPFASAGFLFSNFDAGPTHESDISIPLTFGSEVRFSPQFTLTGEIQLRLSDAFNDDVGFSIGVNSPF